MLRISIHGQNGNRQDVQTDILEVLSDSHEKNNNKIVTVNDAALIRRYDLDGELSQSMDEEDFTDAPDSPSKLSEFKEPAISYMAGYIVKMVRKKFPVVLALQR